MSSKSVTLKDVAAAANVSRATAARALNGYGYVGKEAAERVRLAADKLGYRGNRIAQALRQGELPLIAFVPGDILNPFFSQIAHDLERELRAYQSNLIIASNQEDVELEQQVLTNILALNVKGIIVAPASNEKTPQLSKLIEDKYPLVVIDRVPEGLLCDNITVNNQQGAEEAVEFLIEHGHRRIAVIHDDSRIASTRDRLAGYRLALKNRSISFDETLVVESKSTISHAIDATIRLFHQENKPTAIFTTDSLMTKGALLALRTLGVKIPHEVSIIGFDDFDMATFSDPQITVLSQPVDKIGPLAIKMIMERIAGSQAPAKSIQFPTQLIVRGSVLNI